MKPHFLQSDIWRDFQKQLGRDLVEGIGEGWSYVGIVEHDRFGKYVYVPYGPFATSKKSLVAAVADLKEKAKKVGAYVVYVEPTPPITPAIAASVFKYKGYHRQAHRTIVIDLNKSEDEIIAQMNQTRRNQHRNYQNRGLTIAKDNSKKAFDAFYKLLTLSSCEKGFYVRDKVFFDEIFEKLFTAGNASLFIAKQGDKIEAAALAYEDDDTRYYAQIGRDLTDGGLQANGPLISYMIIDAKRAGKKYFDLYGISESDDKIDERSGFTTFKKTFGGEIVQFGGAWEIPISSPRYYLSRLFRFVKKSIK